MKCLLSRAAALCGAVIISTVTFSSAQVRTPEDGEALQRSLKEKAIRLPARPAESNADSNAARALSLRADTARTLLRRPDLAALREDLRIARAADAERNRESLRALSAPSARGPSDFAAAGPPPPPPPGIRALAADRLASVEREEVERVLLPVLIPAHPDVRDKIKVYGMENVYTATADIDVNASLSVTGTCNRVVGGDPEIAAFRKRLAARPQRRTGTGAAYHISRNDFGVDLSFSKFGCGYVMTVECASPADDIRCAEDDYITGLADSMILANPELAEEE